MRAALLLLGDGAPAVLVGYAVAGAGIVGGFVTLTILALEGVAPDDHGLASGLLTMAQQVGGALGTALAAMAAAWALGSGAEGPAAIAGGTRWALLAGLGLVAAAAALAERTPAWAVDDEDENPPAAGPRGLRRG